MVSRLGRIARGLVATVGVAVIVVGLPAGLLASGAPRVLDRGEISGWLAGNGQFPVRSLWAVVFWLGMAAWLIATSAIVLEAVGYTYRRRSSRLPGLGGLHVVAEWLVRSVAGMVMMSAALRSVPGAGAAPLPAAVVVAGHPADVGETPASPPRTAGSQARVITVSAAATAGRPASTGQRPKVAAATLMSGPPTVVLPPIPGRTIPAGTKVYVVEYHRPTPDTLWRIAADHLGDPLRFHEIVALNVGQLQSDGRRLAPDGHWIYPGWVLELPPDAIGVPVVADTDAPSVSSAGHTTPSAAPRLAAPTTAAPTTTASPTTAPRTQTTTASRSAGGAVAALGPSATATAAPAVNGRVASAGHSGSGPDWLAPTAGVGGATLLATWALLEVRRRRARRLRRSRPGEVMPPVDPTIAPVSAAVHAAADVVGVDRIAAALSHLAKLGNRSLRPQLLLRHPDGRIDVFLATVVASSPPWTAGNKRCWTLAPDAELPPADRDVTPSPALVQLGVCDDGAELYADLEGIGLLGLSGPPETVRQIARALTATLVVSPAARLCRVLTVGFDPYGLDEQVERRLVAAKSVDALIREAEATASEIVAGVAAHNAGSSFRLRSLAPESGWEPTMVVVAGTALASDETARLVELAGEGGQGAAVVCSGVESLWSLDVDDLAAGWWHLSPIDIRMRPVQMAADELAELAAFLADADAEPVRVDVEAPPVPPAPPTPAPIRPTVPAPVREVDVARPAAGAGGYMERPWRVLIRLYGPPDVTNRDGVVVGGEGRDAPLQVLAWLATNRDSATRQGTATAVWCGRAVTPKTVSNALHGARALLRGLAGEPTDGGQWIPTMSERLPLHREAVSDFELLADRVTYARRLTDPAEAADVLSGGLALIRGVPLAGVEWPWPDQHHLTSALAMAASGLATDLAALYFKVGDVGGALEATEVGLRVIPGHEELTRLKIQACIEAGDRAGALAVYEEYERTVMGNDEMVHPAIAKLCDELLKPSRT